MSKMKNPLRRLRRRKVALLIESNPSGLSGRTYHSYTERLIALLEREYGYKEIILLSDSDGTHHDRTPTYANIMRELTKFVTPSRPSDYFFAYLGHSSETCLDSVQDGHDEYIIPCDAVDNTTSVVDETKIITDDTLRQLLTEALPRGSNLVALFDTCHSGTLLDLKHQPCNPQKHKLAFDSSERQVIASEENIFIHNNKGLEKSESVIEKSLIPEIPTISPRDVELHKEIYKGHDYRIHSAQLSGRAIIVKIYEGEHATELSTQTCKFSMNIMHPAFPQIFGATSGSMSPAFIAFCGEYQGTVESIAFRLLSSSLEQSLVLGLQSVVSLASGLDYLCNLDYPLQDTDSFILLLDTQGTAKIWFDPSVPHKLYTDLASFTAKAVIAMLLTADNTPTYRELLMSAIDAICTAGFTSTHRLTSSDNPKG
uniref:Uncharacterized protein n=1 Tax=Psilocybe cubensis TaxID=181762 RepID=A0A8H7XWN5_PSICU